MIDNCVDNGGVSPLLGTSKTRPHIGDRCVRQPPWTGKTIKKTNRFDKKTSDERPERKTTSGLRVGVNVLRSDQTDNGERRLKKKKTNKTKSKKIVLTQRYRVQVIAWILNSIRRYAGTIFHRDGEQKYSARNYRYLHEQWCTRGGRGRVSFFIF